MGREEEELSLGTLVLHLSVPGPQSAQEVVTGGVNCEHFKTACSFGICQCVCSHISLGVDPGPTGLNGPALFGLHLLGRKFSGQIDGEPVFK